MRPGARLSAVARRYGIAGRVLFRWKQEMMPAAAPTFVAVEITDADQERGVRTSCPLYPCRGKADLTVTSAEVRV
jgi:transposase-like protein